MSKPRILYWDLEATNLDANFGYTLCIGYKFDGDKSVSLLKIRDYRSYRVDRTNDKAMIQDFSKVLASADIQITHYGIKFDYPFLQTRSLIHNLPPLPEVTHIDTWRIAKFCFKFNSNRLDTISKAIPVEAGKERELKTPIAPEHWVKASAGYKPSLKYIEEHCIKDIIVLENTYNALKPFAKTHPNISKFYPGKDEGCPICGSFKVQKRGFLINARNKRQRYHCQECSHWFSGPMKKEAA